MSVEQYFEVSTFKIQDHTSKPGAVYEWYQKKFYDIQMLDDTTSASVILGKDSTEVLFALPILKNPRLVYCFGGMLDIETGFLTTSTKSIDDTSVALVSLYDFLFTVYPAFDRDLFKSRLEDLKLNSIGTDMKGLDKTLEYLLGGGAVQEVEGSICLNAIRKSGVITRGGSTLKDEVDYKQLSLKFILFLQGYVTCRDILLNFFHDFKSHTDNYFNYRSSDRKARDRDNNYSLVEDEDGVFFNVADNLYWHTNNKIQQDLMGNTYYQIMQSQDPKEVEQLMKYAFNRKAVKDLITQDCNWVFDSTYMEVSSFNPISKIGKAQRLYKNLDELMNVSQGDEAVEAYNTFKEDYEVAKKQIKKTSIADIVKGSYLTNVLKNKDSMLVKDDFNVTTGYGVTIGEQNKATKRYITLVRQALARL